MDWTNVIAKLRKPEQKLWQQMVTAFDNRDWYDGLRLGEQILKVNPKHAGLNDIVFILSYYLIFL